MLFLSPAEHQQQGLELHVLLSLGEIGPGLHPVSSRLSSSGPGIRSNRRINSCAALMGVNSHQMHVFLSFSLGGGGGRVSLSLFFVPRRRAAWKERRLAHTHTLWCLYTPSHTQQNNCLVRARAQGCWTALWSTRFNWDFCVFTKAPLNYFSLASHFWRFLCETAFVRVLKCCAPETWFVLMAQNSTICSWRISLCQKVCLEYSFISKAASV